MIGTLISQTGSILDTKIGLGIGIIAGAVAAILPNTPAIENFSDVVWFTLPILGHHVAFNSIEILTVVGAFSSLVIAIYSLYKFFTRKR